MTLDRKPTRMLSAGLFGAALFYALFQVFEGRGNDITVIIAIIVEAMLVVASLTRPSPTKRDYGVISLLAAGYVGMSLYFGLFTEMVVMVCGGMLLYAALMSEPKFPMTKRAVSTGVIVGTVMTFLGIYLALKLGVVYFVGAEMLGALLLSLTGKYTKEENTVVVAIANGSSMISTGTLITLPAIAIYQPTVAPLILTYQFIAFVTGLSAIFGLILLVPFRSRFEHDPWPQVKPQAECIISIGGDAEAKRNVAVGLGASFAYTGAVRVAETITSTSLASIPYAFTKAIPDWIGMSNSPLIAAIGYFIGWKRVLTLALGTVITVAIWIVLEGANPAVLYSNHLRRPEILYLVLGVFAAVILGDFVSSRKKDIMTPEEFEKTLDASRMRKLSGQLIIDTPHKPSEVLRRLRVKETLFSVSEFREELRRITANPRAYLQSTRSRLPPWVGLLSISLFTVIGILVFSVIRPFYGVEIHWLLFVLGAPLVLISAYFTARAISETAMLAGYISDIVAIPAIVFLRTSFQAITAFMAMMGALQDAAIAVLVHLKLGGLTGVRGRDIVKAVFIGAMLATLVGSLITYGIYVTEFDPGDPETHPGFGTSNYPAPVAQLFLFLVTSLQGLGNFQLPGVDQFGDVHPAIAFAYLMAFGVVGYLLGRELNRRGGSAISLAVGLLIPPVTAATMLIGGFIDYRLKKQASSTVPSETQFDQWSLKESRMSRVLSGIVAGEAVMIVVWVFWNALRSFLT